MGSSNETPTVVPGCCLCGRVAFEVTLPTAACVHCHCTMCQRSNGAGCVTWVVVPRTRFLLVRGEDDLRTYQSSDHGTRSFCKHCGSSMFCDLEEEPETIDITLANLQGSIDRVPQSHIFFSDRAEWVSVDDSLPRRGGESGMKRL